MFERPEKVTQVDNEFFKGKLSPARIAAIRAGRTGRADRDEATAGLYIIAGALLAIIPAVIGLGVMIYRMIFGF